MEGPKRRETLALRARALRGRAAAGGAPGGESGVGGDRQAGAAAAEHGGRRRERPIRESGVTIWSKTCFVVDFRNLLFDCDFDLLFSKGYSLMKIFNYEVDFIAKCDT